MKRSANPSLFIGLCVAAAIGGWAIIRAQPSRSSAPRSPVVAMSAAPDAAGTEHDVSSAAPNLEVPQGGPPRLSCSAARAVIAHVRAELAQAPLSPNPEELAELWAGWFDPHGLWSAAPDSPLADLARQRATALIAELEATPLDTSPCSSAGELGTAAHAWVSELRALFEEARARAEPRSASLVIELASSPIFEDDPVSRPGRELAAELGRRLGALSVTMPELGPVAQGALDRLLPDLGAEEWAEAALAAMVRAYVPAVDPHGQWAPADEETSLYLGDPALDGGPLLWGDMIRTGFGVRLTNDPAPPLQVDDVVLAVDGVETPGLSVEQIEQLSRIGPKAETQASRVTLLRPGSERPLEIWVPVSIEGAEEEITLDAERVAYGDGEVLVVHIEEVGDVTGEELGDLIEQAGDHPPDAVLLDLRGNGGGSTDGALAALGVFLPGAPSFPLIYRGVVREVLHAPSLAAKRSWPGPVSALVDGYTASAAEMIAGAIQAYGRGAVIGARTFGKGCIQEYFDHQAGGGVLRLTTLQYVLPNGAAVQRTGLEPSVLLELGTPPEREADLPRALSAFRGPDVRDRQLFARSGRGGAAALVWPEHHGRLGPCADPALCRALRALGRKGPGFEVFPKNRIPSRARARLSD